MNTTREWVIVDIDSTLFDFSWPVYNELVKINPDFPTPDKWYEWNMWDGFVTKNEFFKCVNTIHSNILDYEPFPYASELLELLSEKYNILIASNKNKKHYDSTEKWLKYNNLKHDLIFLSYDKTVILKDKLFKIKYVIDDSPSTLLKVKKDHNIEALGIEYPWNKGIGENIEHEGSIERFNPRLNKPYLFSSLQSIYNYLSGNCEILC